jgi:hypothetical protein
MANALIRSLASGAAVAFVGSALAQQAPRFTPYESAVNVMTLAPTGAFASMFQATGHNLYISNIGALGVLAELSREILKGPRAKPVRYERPTDPAVDPLKNVFHFVIPPTAQVGTVGYTFCYSTQDTARFEGHVSPQGDVAARPVPAAEAGKVNGELACKTRVVEVYKQVVAGTWQGQQVSASPNATSHNAPDASSSQPARPLLSKTAKPRHGQA